MVTTPSLDEVKETGEDLLIRRIKEVQKQILACRAGNIDRPATELTLLVKWNYLAEILVKNTRRELEMVADSMWRMH